MSSVERLFNDHPNSVGESYAQHLGTALFFAGRMFVGTFVCLVHALLPFLFVKTGSSIIEELHHKMITARHRNATVEQAAANRVPPQSSLG